MEANLNQLLDHPALLGSAQTFVSVPLYIQCALDGQNIKFTVSFADVL